MRQFSILLFLFIPLNVFAQISVNTSNDWAWNQVGVRSDFKKLVGKKNITIAIIDDAFQVENQTLKTYLKYNTKDFPENNIDDDGNGKIDDYLGWDMSDNDPDVSPAVGSLAKFGHGTKVAGIMIEGLNKLLLNAKDVIKILPIKSSSDTRNSNYITDGYEAIQYAIDQNVDIIVCCWSGGAFEKEKEEILLKAKKAGIIIIAASGNFTAEKEQFPGAFPWAINTAALSKNLQKQSVSNYGKFVDISLPGDSLFTISTLPNGPLTTLSGTSASTAFLSGIVAAIYTAFPTIESADFDRILKNACVPLEPENPLYKAKLGAGLLNVSKLIKMLEQNEEQIVFTTPKSYLQLSKSEKLVKAYAKYPRFKLANTKSKSPKNFPVIIEKWNENTKSDTIISFGSLVVPYYFQADSFRVSTKKQPKGKQPAYLYYEAQTIDSSYLYCNQTVHLSEKTGQIEDGSGNENYANNSNCKWEIEVTKEKRIKIFFEEMDTEAGIDQIYIFSDFGTESPILAIFSGQNLPPQITTWTNRALVWFVTNGTTNLKGWKLKYEEVD